MVIFIYFTAWKELSYILLRTVVGALFCPVLSNLLIKFKIPGHLGVKEKLKTGHLGVH